MNAPLPGGRGRSLNPPSQHRNTATPEGDGKSATDETRRAAYRACRHIADSRDVFSQFVRAIETAGLIGESRNAKLVYLAVTSRLFTRPVSIVVKGPSSAGKSYLIEAVLKFFPSAAYYALSAMSERALAYSTEPLEHRMLVLYEAGGLSGQIKTYLLRSLLSEGCVRYETVEKTKDGLKARLIHRPGPTGLLLTTTEARLHSENETRMLSLTISDSREQTRAVMKATAGDAAKPLDLSAWHAFQTWLELGEHCVVVPFSRRLAQLIPPVALRLRRDFATLRSLIEAHALIHRKSRRSDKDGQIIATLDDYAAVRGLVADLIAEGVEATVSATDRETVEAVGALTSENFLGVSVTDLAAYLKIDKASASRRVNVAMKRGYLFNDEERKGHPARIRVGEAMPEEMEILPSVEKLRSRVR
jgi:hypothetical protein